MITADFRKEKQDFRISSSNAEVSYIIKITIIIDDGYRSKLS